METIAREQISVDRFFDSAVAQQTARQFICKLGFAGQASQEIVLAVAELASGLARHGGCGVITLRPLRRGERIGIEVELADRSPGTRDVERAFEDGHSRRDGLGYELGTVNRLMDEVEIGSMPALGTRVLCRRWLRSEADGARAHAWQVGVATQSRRQVAANGDAFVIREWEGHLLAGVIDGLGHGEPAQTAALAAQSYVQSHHYLPLDELFRGVSRACRGTRGVVMALARFESATAMTLANLGNIEIRTWTGAQRVDFAVKRGFLGTREDEVRVEERHWEPDWMLVLHSDGLHAQWRWIDFPGLEHENPQAVADKLLSKLAKDDDDATVLAVRN